MDHRGKTVTKPLPLSRLGLPLSEKQIPQVVENLESGGKPKEALERVAMRPRQVRYQAALRPDISTAASHHKTLLKQVPNFHRFQPTKRCQNPRHDQSCEERKIAPAKWH